MTWYAVYNSTTGELVSVGTVIADVLPDGLSLVAIGESRPDGVWNPTTYAFDPAPPQPKASITKLAFLRRIPSVKRIAIREAAKTDPILDDAMGLLDLAEDVNTDDTDTVQLVGYLQMQGHLTAEEAAVVLA